MDKLGTIRRRHWKERLKISIIAKFGSELLKTEENIAPHILENLQTFVWGSGWMGLTDNWQMAKILTDNWHLPWVLLTTDKGPDCPLFCTKPVFTAF